MKVHLDIRKRAHLFSFIVSSDAKVMGSHISLSKYYSLPDVENKVVTVVLDFEKMSLSCYLKNDFSHF